MDKEKLREILNKLIGSHTPPCDCLQCRKDGRIDQAIASILELEEKVKEEVREGWKMVVGTCK